MQHIICNDDYGDHKIAELFFKINDELNQLLQVDARDNLGRTPLQWAVASFLPDVVDVLLNRGADLSSFVFPSESHFDEGVGSRYYISDPNYKLILVPSALAVVECLEKRVYEMKRSDALTLMAVFDKHGFFVKLADCDEYWYDDEEFVRMSKEIMIIPSLSLYDLIQLQLVEDEKLLTFMDYFEFACSYNFWILPPRPRKACFMHLC
uniref:Uncharacterized protein n=1 Tax=Trichogramma kaykai TaxID=54128 RepID=A0ABD2WM52_9HYME